MGSWRMMITMASLKLSPGLFLQTWLFVLRQSIQLARVALEEEQLLFTTMGALCPTSAMKIKMVNG